VLPTLKGFEAGFLMAAIQPAQPHHFAVIADLNVEAYREYANYLTAEAWMTMQTNLRSVETQAQQRIFLVAFHSNALAGSVAYCPPGHSHAPIPSDRASVLLLAVSPSYRQQGIGRSLLHACVHQARKDGAQTIGLFTSEVMIAACQLYESYGFCKDCELPQRLGLRYWRYRFDLTAIAVAAIELNW
jgi:ribosomal protein S18 acetylase RimI-like enzyme